MKRRTQTSNFDLQFKYLPGFASFIINNHLKEYVLKQLQLFREINVPLYQFFKDIPEEQMLANGLQSNRDYLTYFVENRAADQIADSIEKFKKNQLPNIRQQDIVAEDITAVTFIRRQAFMSLVPLYCTDMEQMLGLIKELDEYLLELETASTNVYIDLLQHRIEEHAHLIQQINNTIPGAVYVFDVERFAGIYSNNKLPSIIGYTQDELNALGTNAVSDLIHPDDLAETTKNLKLVTASKDGEIQSYKYRIKNKDGQYRWVRNYEAVFKRNTQNKVVETIGITLDIDKEQKLAEELQEREKQLLDAQEIAQIGSFSWSFNAGLQKSSPQLQKLLDINYDNVEGFMNKVHPADRPKVEAALQKAIQETGIYDIEFRYQHSEGEKIIWSRGLVNYKNGQPQGMYGTVMDITERQRILNKLKESEKGYKLAESLTHIGNYKLDLEKQTVEISDELYRIYGYEPGDKSVTYQTVIDLRHPDDYDTVQSELEAAMRENRNFDFYYRTLPINGVEKILHSRGQVEVSEDGKSKMLIGTTQDVTEKQTLIRRLRQSEHLYQQAEALSNMGNWTWNTDTGKIIWTDQLYKIYGLAPQSEEINIERFLSFLHPDDRRIVEESLAKEVSEDFIDLTFRIITDNGQVKTLRSIAQPQKNGAGKIIGFIGTEQDITERQKLIDRLERSETLYKQAQGIAKLGNWAYDMKTGLTTWSDVMYDIYEIPKDSEIGLEFFLNFIHPDDRDPIMNYFRECIEKKTPYDRKHRLILQSGKVKTVHRKGELKLNEAGEVLQIFGTTQDITEQQAIENSLKENQTFIRKITDATPSIITSYNINTGQYVFVSEGLEKLLGYDASLPLAQGVSFFVNLVHPDDLAPLMQKNTEALEEANGNKDRNDMVIEFTYRMKHKNGQYRWFHTYGTIFDRNSEGLVEHILNISLDVTKQVEADLKIKEQEHFIQRIADASPTILYLFETATDSISYINKEIYYVLGYTPDEIVESGADVTELIYHPDDIELLPERRLSKKKFEHLDSMVQYECRMKNKSGAWCWLLVREIVFKKDADNKVVQVLGAALDITKRKEMEKTILQNSFQLEQSNASLEEFAYVASHDLKEPLRKISTFGDRLMNSQMDRLSDDGKIYLKKIVDASQRMQVMITDLLSVSMISGDKSFQPYSLQSILEDVLQTLEFKMEQKGAQIKSDPLPEANIVPSQFRQLFQNILSNSLKFVREDVQPMIGIHHSYLQPADVAHLQVAKAPRYHQLQFKDNGIGFEEEYAGKIFAIFQRLHGRSEYEGTGIGLAICKKIVEHHKGVIYANGQPDKGATFTIILPE